MLWLGILVVSPIWGIVSTTLFLQIWLALANAVIELIGFVKGTVSRKSTSLALGVSVAAAVVFSLLLQGGYWIISAGNFGASNAESIVYWLFASVTLIGIAIEVPKKIGKSWRNATVRGSLEADIQQRVS